MSYIYIYIYIYIHRYLLFLSPFNSDTIEPVTFTVPEVLPGETVILELPPVGITTSQTQAVLHEENIPKRAPKRSADLKSEALQLEVKTSKIMHGRAEREDTLLDLQIKYFALINRKMELEIEALENKCVES